MLTLLAIFLGAGLGGVARYGVGLAAAKTMGEGFPFATLTVNLLGAFLLGCLIQYWVLHPGWEGPLERTFFITGFLGGFTTFSAFSYELMLLLGKNEPGTAVLYGAVSVLGGLLALSCGLGLVKHFAG